VFRRERGILQPAGASLPPGRAGVAPRHPGHGAGQQGQIQAPGRGPGGQIQAPDGRHENWVRHRVGKNRDKGSGAPGKRSCRSGSSAR
jgi:hypothetical protein